MMRSQLGFPEAITLIQSILDGESNNPLCERYTMKQFQKAKQGIKVPNLPAMTGEQAMNELLSGQKIDPYDLVPKPEIGNMEDFFDEMTETEVSHYKINHVAKYLSIPS